MCVHNTQAVQLRESLIDLCTKTADLLRKTLGIVPGGRRESLLAFVNADLVASIVGTFEQNNVGVRCRSPLRPFADSIAAQAKAGEPQPIIAVAHELMKLEDMVRESCDDDHDHDHDHEHEHHAANGDMDEGEIDVEDPETIESLVDLIESTADSEIDPLFTPLDGTALFSTTCIMNHSCQPNVLIAFVDAPAASSASTPLPQQPTSPLQIEVIALRDIAPGEELCFSYIATDMPAAERAHALSEYDIKCTCERCTC
jgi:hypothetical protein